jgi:phosphocarrier protein HPr
VIVSEHRREVVIRNKEGLHFRPIMKFVDTATGYEADISVHCNERKADGRSPMELLMLVATQGTEITLVARGEDADQALTALADLVESGFGEC